MSISVTNKLLPQVYEVVEMNLGGNKEQVLQALKPRFEVPSKIYGEYVENIEHMFSFYHAGGINMGCLFHGEAGAGKSLTAELMCNMAIDHGMPVIYIRGVGGVNNNSFVEKYIELFKTFRNVCIYIDEFGKIFDMSSQTKFLSILTDLSANNLWILTENNEKIISPFISRRPGRIRYNIEFNKITEKAVLEYCQDHPIPENIYFDLMEKYYSTDLFTFDQLQALVSEIQYCVKRYGGIVSIDEICTRLNVRDVLTTYIFKIKKIFYMGKEIDKSEQRYNSVNVVMDYKRNRIWNVTTLPVTMRDMNRILGGPSNEISFDMRINREVASKFTEDDIENGKSSLNSYFEGTGQISCELQFPDIGIDKEIIDGREKRFVCCSNDYFKIVYSVYSKSGEEIYFE